MRRIPFDLNSVRAARELRAGKSPRAISAELGMSVRNVERVDASYDNVPDVLLARIERLLSDREKLRAMVSTLLRRNELIDV